MIRSVIELSNFTSNVVHIELILHSPVGEDGPPQTPPPHSPNVHDGGSRCQPMDHMTQRWDEADAKSGY